MRVKIQGIEVNLEGAKQMKKAQLVAMFERFGKDGIEGYKECIALIKANK